MQVPPGTRLSMGILLLGFLAVSAAALEADAAPIVLKIDATLTDPDFAVSASDTDLNVAPGAEITLANGTNVGAFFFDDEFVDVSSNAALSFLQYLAGLGVLDRYWSACTRRVEIHARPRGQRSRRTTGGHTRACIADADSALASLPRQAPHGARARTGARPCDRHDAGRTDR